jgi:thiamine pyrophosphate-dependent acetolactate synthase large subunit-like protein
LIEGVSQMAAKLDGPVATGAEEVVRFLQDRKIGHVFGLPGSSLVSLLAELAQSEIRIVPTIHESVVVAAADGYARVAGQGAAYLYMMPGTANALANLYNAWRDESPILVLASQQASALRTFEGTVGEGDLVPVVQPFTRHARELTLGMPVYHNLAAAMRAATGFPSGPSFVSLPEDVLEASVAVRAVPETIRVPSGAPDVRDLAKRLAAAERPLLVVGGQVRRYGGTEALERLAQRHGIAVAGEPGFIDRLAISPSHECWIGSATGVSGAAAEQQSDFVLVVGGRFISEGHPREQPFFPAAGFVGHVNADPAKLEETRVANWSCACDPAAFLASLETALDEPDAVLIGHRRDFIQACRSTKLPDDPFSQSLAAYGEAAVALHDALDRGWVVDESVMGSVALINSLTSRDGRRYLGSTGGSLGWGTGAAVGVALASGEPVTCVLGDGALRFGIHGLWTAVAERLPITFVILDNGGYGSTRYFARAYAERTSGGHNSGAAVYPGMDFRDVGSTLESIIAGLGVRSVTSVDVDDARAAVEQAWATCADGPNAVIIRLPFGD